VDATEVVVVVCTVNTVDTVGAADMVDAVDVVGGVTLGYAVGSETSAGRPRSHHTESEPPFVSCATISCVT